MEHKSDRSPHPCVDLSVLFDDLVRFETELWDLVDAELRSVHDLPLSWYEPMGVIHDTPDCRVVDIAEALSITVGGISKLIDRISAAGLLVRTPHPDDGRSSVIALTTAGQEVLADARRTFAATLERCIGSAISPRRLAQLAASIRQLRLSLPDQTRSS